MNFLIQGPAATVMKKALIAVDHAFRSNQWDAHIISTVHDEVVTECRPELVDKVAQLLYSMTDRLMPVELPVEPATGLRLGEMKDVEVSSYLAV